MEFLVEVNSKVYEISELVKSVSFTDKLNDGCSKLEFSFIDPEKKLGLVGIVDDELRKNRPAVFIIIFASIDFFKVLADTGTVKQFAQTT